MYSTEHARIDLAWRRGIPMIIGSTQFGTAAAFGCIAVVEMKDYRDWWGGVGKELGAPDPDKMKPTTEEHVLKFDAQGHGRLVPQSDEP